MNTATVAPKSSIPTLRRKGIIEAIVVFPLNQQWQSGRYVIEAKLAIEASLGYPAQTKVIKHEVLQSRTDVSIHMTLSEDTLLRETEDPR